MGSVLNTIGRAHVIIQRRKSSLWPLITFLVQFWILTQKPMCFTIALWMRQFSRIPLKFWDDYMHKWTGQEASQTGQKHPFTCSNWYFGDACLQIERWYNRQQQSSEMHTINANNQGGSWLSVCMKSIDLLTWFTKIASTYLTPQNGLCLYTRWHKEIC